MSAASPSAPPRGAPSCHRAKCAKRDGAVSHHLAGRHRRHNLHAMNKEAVIRILVSHIPELQERGARSLYLYGSTARDEAQADSDVDMFIDYDPETRFSLVELAGLKLYLQDLLGTEADVLTRDSLHPRLKDRILKESIRIF